MTTYRKGWEEGIASGDAGSLDFTVLKAEARNKLVQIDQGLACHSFAAADLPEEKVRAIGASRMDARHTHLDDMLKE